MRPPTLILTPGAWLGYMLGYGLVTLLRWLVVTAYRVIRWVLLYAIEHGRAMREQARRREFSGVVVPFRRPREKDLASRR